MGNEQPVRSFYRVVKKNPPTDRDYVSRQERQGDPPNDATEEERRSWDALSFFDTEERARHMALQIPALGKFVARYDIPADAGVVWEQTIAPGHYDIRGDKEMIKRCLSDHIVPV